MEPKYQLIYLNGPSSAGKSTLAALLQEKLHQPFLAVGIDTLIGLMPKKTNNWSGDGRPAIGFTFRRTADAGGNTLLAVEAGPFGAAVARAFVETVTNLARLGHYVIIDDVALKDGEVECWKKALQPFSTLYVGVQAALPDLVRRERERGDRSLGSARDQFAKISFDSGYDLVVNTSEHSLERCAEEIVRRTL